MQGGGSPGRFFAARGGHFWATCVGVGVRGVWEVGGSRVRMGLCCGACQCVWCRGRVQRRPGDAPSRVSVAAAAQHCTGRVSLACQRSRSSGGAPLLQVIRLRPLSRWRGPPYPCCVRRQGCGVRATGHRAIAAGRLPAGRLQPPLGAGAIASGSGRHLRFRFCSGWGCGGGGFLEQ